MDVTSSSAYRFDTPTEALPRQLPEPHSALGGLYRIATDPTDRGLARKKGRRIVVGFAAETHDVLAEARRKLREKRLDLIVANDVSAPGIGFGSDDNAVRLLDASGGDETLDVRPKDAVADRILDWVVQHRSRRIRRVAPRLRRVR